MDTKKAELSSRQNKWMAIKFVLFSISAGVIETVSYFLLNEFTDIDKLINIGSIFGNKYGLTYFIALVLSVLWNFTLNRKFTFKSVANVPIAMLKVFGYYLVFTPVSIWWTVKLTNLHYNEYLVLLGTMVINLTTEYIFDRFVVYRNNIFTNEEGQRYLSKRNGENKSDI
jgi:Predicted membrane protein